MAKTRTSTRAFPRIELIAIAIDDMLTNHTELDAETIRKVVDQGVRRRKVSAISLYGLDSDSEWRVRLSVSIDWQEHNRQLAVKPTLELRTQQDGALSPKQIMSECTGLLSTFDDFIKLHSLRVHCVVRAGGSHSSDSIRDDLGIDRVFVPQKSGQALDQIIELNSSRLSEVSIKIG